MRSSAELKESQTGVIWQAFWNSCKEWRELKISSLIPTEATLWSINDWADFWRYKIGANVIPADTRNKKPKSEWKKYQAVPIPEQQHEQWKQENAFADGIAMIIGKLWHNDGNRGLYLIFIDLDNRRAIDEFCTRNGNTLTLDDLSKYMIIEQHTDEPYKAHAYFYSKHPFLKKSSDFNNQTIDNVDEIPAIEVKGLGQHGLAFCCPSPHANGHNYEIIGSPDVKILDDLEQHIDNICRKYQIAYLNNEGKKRSLIPIQDLFKTDTKVYEGHNRHEALLRVMESLIKRNAGILDMEQIRQFCSEWNLEHCYPQLDKSEEDKQWKDAIKFIEKTYAENENKGNLENSDSGDEPTIPHTNAELLIKLAIENSKLLFKDQYGAAFALVNIIDHTELIPMDSHRFKRYLAKLFYDNYENSVVGTDAINNSILILQAKAEYDYPTIPLHLRVAWSNPEKDSIYYDLTDDNWRQVEIKRGGPWRIIDSHDSPVLFRRHHQIAQVLPVETSDLRIFDKFLDLTNVKERNDRLLLKVWIISTFIPDIARVILQLYGGQGSAKSVLQTMIKRLTDPAILELLTISKDRSEFVRQLDHNHVCFYDNIRHIPYWLSDEACKAATGIGNSNRKLYTDDDDIARKYKRCLGFNGLNISLTAPDALDRSITIRVKRIDQKSREQEEKIYSDFGVLEPGLLGYIFDVISRTLQIKDEIKLADLPRMADFAVWGEAIARSMGCGHREFIDAYYENIGKQNVEAIEDNLIGQTIVKLWNEIEDEYLKNNEKLKEDLEWEGSISECLKKLTEVAVDNNINVGSKYFPKAPNQLSRRINEIRSSMVEGLGIEVTIRRLTTNLEKKDDKNYEKTTIYKKHTTMVKIRKISAPAAPAALDPNDGKI